MLLRLSQHINNEADLRKLATLGLEVDENIIDSCITKKRPDISAAAHDILKVWRRSYEDQSVAYTKLCQILYQVSLAHFVNYLKQ